MESKNRKINIVYVQEVKNQPNFNNTVIIQKTSNSNIDINQYPNTVIYGYKKPINIDINMDIDNVHSKDLKKYSENNTLNNTNDISNNQNRNIQNYNYLPRKTNPQKKIMIQRIISKAYQKHKNSFSNTDKIPLKPKISVRNILYMENEIVNNSMKSIDSLSNDNSQNLEENKKFIRVNLQKRHEKLSNKKSFNENKKNNSFSMSNEVKDNSQHIITSNKDNNENETIENNNINGNYSKSKSNSGEMKINEIREELRLIHDNRKYNYDKKVQKINPAKNHIPKSKKIVERMLGLNKKN